jgi:hypothetical protein
LSDNTHAHDIESKHIDFDADDNPQRRTDISWAECRRADALV